MKMLAITVSLLCLLFQANAQPNQRGGKQMESITITRSGSQPSTRGQAEYFTGSVRIDPLFSVVEPSRVAGARVTFEPSARTAWHKHPLGQVLIVTAGTGWVQQEGASVQEMRQGDVVRIPPV